MPKANVALMCKSHNYYTKPNTSNITSPAWVLGEKRAQSLIGQTVILTESKSTPAYIGGTITAVNHTATQKGYDGRLLSCWKRNASCFGRSICCFNMELRLHVHRIHWIHVANGIFCNLDFNNLNDRTTSRVDLVIQVHSK